MKPEVKMACMKCRIVVTFLEKSFSSNSVCSCCSGPLVSMVTAELLLMQEELRRISSPGRTHPW